MLTYSIGVGVRGKDSCFRFVLMQSGRFQFSLDFVNPKQTVFLFLCRCEEATSGSQKTSFYISKTDWVNAPEFVPSQPKPPKSYAQAVNPMDDTPEYFNPSQQSLCPYISKDGFCRYPPGECSNLHGEMCDMCCKAVIHPYNEEERKKHRQVSLSYYQCH